VKKKSIKSGDYPGRVFVLTAVRTIGGEGEIQRYIRAYTWYKAHIDSRPRALHSLKFYAEVPKYVVFANVKYR
jgi:hypothetical protein